MANQRERLYYITNIRVMAMLCIVIYHSLCFYAGTWGFVCADEITPLWKLIAPPIVNLGLTAFVLVSGFLYGLFYCQGKYQDTGRFIYKKATRLLVPYMVWSVYQIYCVPGLERGWKSMLYGMSHLWFLLMLFEIFVMVAVLNKFHIADRTTKKVDVFVLIMSFLPYFISKYCLNAHSILALEISFKYLPVFIVGVFMNKYQIHQKIKKSIATIGCLIGGGFYW